MDEVISKTSAEIVEVVNVLLNPLSDPNTRLTAHQVFENFRDSSPHCAKCGFFIACHYENPALRHFGLQLIDYYIKIRWNSMDLDEKVWLKNGIMESISKGINANEQLYIKDAISRIVVELIKREWPQQWPTLLDELDQLCSLGDKETEVVLLIFLRLIEDVVLIQNFPDQRRRDIRTALTSNIERILLFFWQTLKISYEFCMLQKEFDPKSDQVSTKSKLADLALETIAVCVEMIPLSAFIEIVGFNKLCTLLENTYLRNKAALCLLNIIEIQTSVDARLQLLDIFEEDSLYGVAKNFLNCKFDLYDEQQSYFLKLMSGIFLSMSQILYFSMSKKYISELPKKFLPFLECCVLFIKHPSLASLHGLNMLLNIIRIPILTSQDNFTELIPSILKLDVEKLVKIEALCKEDLSIWKLEFGVDDEDEFRQISNSIRKTIVDCLREIVKLQPNLAFSLAKTLIQCLLREGNWASLMESEDLGRNVLACWKALVDYLEPICAMLTNHLHREDISIVKEFSADGLMLLNLILNFDYKDPDILSYALSCMSNLFIFVTFSDSDHCVKVLQKIFLSLSYEGDNLNGLLELKRHASALLIKLSTNFPQLLFPHFDYIYQHICEFSKKLVDFTQFERKCALTEAMLVLSNEICDFDKQSAFIREILLPVEQLWMSTDIQMGISTPENFVTLLGIDTPFDPNSKDQSPTTGSKAIKLCLSIFNAVSRRCIYPKDPVVAKKGNYMHPLSQSFNTVYFKNPAAPYLLSKIPGMFQIIKLFNSLYEPSNKNKIHPSYMSVLEADTFDRDAIPGLVNRTAPENKSRLYRMEMYFSDIYKLCLTTLGCCAEFLNMDFYLIPDLPNYLKNYIFCELPHVTDKRIRIMIQFFLKPFFLCCPPTSDQELICILSAFLKFMHQKLNSIWDKFRIKYGNSIECEEDQTEVKDITEDLLNRLLSRTHIEFILDLLLKSSSKSSLSDENDEMIDDSKPAKTSKSLSPFGKTLFEYEDTRRVLICTAFDSLHWPDTAVNFKSRAVCEILFKQLSENKLICTIHDAEYILQCILRSIHVHGQHDSNLVSLLCFGTNVYENLKLSFPAISQSLLELIDCDCNHVKALDDIIAKNPVKSNKRDKLMRDAFKKAIEKIIGIDIGQQHKKNIIIKNLSPLIKFSQKESSSIFDTTDEEYGLCNLFTPQDKEN